MLFIYSNWRSGPPIAQLLASPQRAGVLRSDSNSVFTTNAFHCVFRALSGEGFPHASPRSLLLQQPAGAPPLSRMQLQGAMHRSSLRKSTAYSVAKPHALWPLPGTAPTRRGRVHACNAAQTRPAQLSAPWRPAPKSRPATKTAYSNDSSSSTAGSRSSGSSSEASSSSSASAAQVRFLLPATGPCSPC